MSHWVSIAYPTPQKCPLLGLLKSTCGNRGVQRTLPDSVGPAFQIITALEEDGTAQKMQLGYRLQQIAAAVENKVTDL